MKQNRIRIYVSIGLLLAMLISAVPVAFAQVINPSNPVPGNKLLSVSTLVDVKPWDITIGQSCLIQGLLYPPAPYDQNVNITLTAPNGTKIVKPQTLTTDIHECWFTFTPDAVGIWGLSIQYGGDSTYRSSSNSFRKVLTVHPASEVMPVPPTTRSTKGFIGTVPKDKVGVGDAIYIVGWVSPPRELQGGIFWSDYSFVVTKPDGTTETVVKKPDSPATASFSYVCASAGTYSVKMTFPGDDHLGFFKFLPCESQTTTWVAEAGYKAPQYPAVPFPTRDFQWKYPVGLEFYEWYQITGSWPIDGSDPSQANWNPYTWAPNSPHVLWRYVASPGGIMGGPTGYLGFTGGSGVGSYSWQGKVWTTQTRLDFSTSATASFNVAQLVMRDIFTGNVEKVTDLPVSSASIIALELDAREKIDPRQAVSIGQRTNLWMSGGGGIFTVNPFTGSASSIYNLSTGNTFGTGPSGQYYAGKMYVTTTNSTTGHDYLASWDTGIRAYDWTGVDLGSAYRVGDYIDTTQNPPIWVRAQVDYGGWPIDTKISTWSLDTGNLMVDGKPVPGVQVPEGAPGRFVVGWGNWYVHGDDRKVHAFSEKTGQLAWSSDNTWEYPWGDFGAYNSARGYNIIYFNGWDGYLYGNDAATGKLVMKVYSANAYQETAMGTYPFWGTTLVADGKVYCATDQHTKPNPYPRGDALYCANALTGEKIWTLQHISGGGGLIASGVLIKTDSYSGATYAIGKGSSATTVAASPKVQGNGGTILIEGTVMDMSPGSPNTPAVSDASQESWVPYLWMNMPKPQNATGVEVVLRAVNVDSGSVSDIGRTTSDSLGAYQFAWKPSETGTYKILATFEGSESYYSSSAETGAAVVAAAPVVVPTETPTTTVAPTETPTVTGSPSASASPIVESAVPLLTLVVAIVAIIVIVLAAVIALARRRKK